MSSNKNSKTLSPKMENESPKHIMKARNAAQHCVVYRGTGWLGRFDPVTLLRSGLSRIQIDAMIRSMIESNDDWSEKAMIIQSVFLKELGDKRKEEGMNDTCESYLLTSIAYMVPFNVVRQKGRFKDFFEGLIARRKSDKAAMIAVMRKLLSTLNVML